MQYFSDGGNKLIRVDFDGAVETSTACMRSAMPRRKAGQHRMAGSIHRRQRATSCRADGWQHSPSATSDIMQSGWLERIAEGEVPVEQARMRAEASA
ncbi:MAG: hypothetical protein QOE74_4278 [Mycobacterium sp.]|jgi:hypothetical protein|nr:hypothetical protein [Mycobacterium sp.]